MLPSLIFLLIFVLTTVDTPLTPPAFQDHDQYLVDNAWAGESNPEQEKMVRLAATSQAIDCSGPS